MNIEVIQPNEWSDWTSIPNVCIFDPNIDESAFRLYCYLKSRPNGWNYNISHLCKVFNWGKDKAYKKMQMLKKSGWVEIIQKRKNGKFSKDITLKVLIKPFNEISLNDGDTIKAPFNDFTVNGEIRSPKNTVNGEIININNTESINNTDLFNNTLSKEESQKQKKEVRDVKSLIGKTTIKLKAKNLSLKEFKNYIVQNFKGKFKFKALELGYKQEVDFMLNESGYLHNSYAMEDLNRDEAIQMWNYLFKKREKVFEHLNSLT